MNSVMIKCVNDVGPRKCIAHIVNQSTSSNEVKMKLKSIVNAMNVKTAWPWAFARRWRKDQKINRRK